MVGVGVGVGVVVVVVGAWLRACVRVYVLRCVCVWSCGCCGCRRGWSVILLVWVWFGWCRVVVVAFAGVVVGVC